MATGKSSFVLYVDIIHTVRKLPKDKVADLFLTILAYVNDENPKVDDPMVDIVFEPIKQQLKRDLKKWEKTLKKKSEGGKKGMAARWKKDKIVKDPITTDNIVKESITTITDNVNVNDTVTVNVNDNVTVNDAEKEILANPIQLEQICMSTKNNDLDKVKTSLRKFHLHLEENDKYPQKRKQVFAGFEKWLLNEKKFNNGTHQQTFNRNSKPGTPDEQADAADRF